LDREEDHTKPPLVLFLAQRDDKCGVLALAVNPTSKILMFNEELGSYDLLSETYQQNPKPATLSTRGYLST
jgi:hypothetical protein